MVEGLRYVRHNRLVLGAISLDLFAVLLGGATAMLPVFARDILHAGPEGLGPLRAAPAVGATLTAVFFSFRPLKTNVGVKMLAAVGVFGAATIVFGLSTLDAPVAGLLALLGAADMFSVYVRQSLIQLHTPDEMRGRVGAVSTLSISASNELGEARSGFSAACSARRRDRRRRRRGDRRDSAWAWCSRNCGAPHLRAFRNRPRKADVVPTASDALQKASRPPDLRSAQIRGASA